MQKIILNSFLTTRGTGHHKQFGILHGRIYVTVSYRIPTASDGWPTPSVVPPTHDLSEVEVWPLLVKVLIYTGWSKSTPIDVYRRVLSDTLPSAADTRPEMAGPDEASIPHSGDPSGLNHTTMYLCPSPTHQELRQNRRRRFCLL